MRLLLLAFSLSVIAVPGSSRAAAKRPIVTKQSIDQLVLTKGPNAAKTLNKLALKHRGTSLGDHAQHALVIATTTKELARFRVDHEFDFDMDDVHAYTKTQVKKALAGDKAAVPKLRHVAEQAYQSELPEVIDELTKLGKPSKSILQWLAKRYAGTAVGDQAFVASRKR